MLTAYTWSRSGFAFECEPCNYRALLSSSPSTIDRRWSATTSQPHVARQRRHVTSRRSFPLAWMPSALGASDASQLDASPHPLHSDDVVLRQPCCPLRRCEQPNLQPNSPMLIPQASPSHPGRPWQRKHPPKDPSSAWRPPALPRQAGQAVQVPRLSLGPAGVGPPRTKAKKSLVCRCR
jgi:hypothetical protein